MQKAAKITTSILSIIFLLFIILIGAIFFLINPNNYKNQITSAASEKLGRTLSINGDIKLSLFPWPGIQIHQIQLNNPATFKEPVFAKLDEADISFQLWPLLRKNLIINKVKLDGLQVNLIRTADNKNNWQDLTDNTNQRPVKNTNAVSNASETASSFQIEDVELNNASVSWDDMLKKQKINLSNLNLQADNIYSAHNVPLDLNFNFSNQQPKLNGNFQLTGKLSSKDNRYTINSLNISSRIDNNNKPVNLTLQGDLVFDNQQQILQINKLNGNFAGIPIQGDMTATQVNTSPTVKGNLVINRFSPREILNQLGYEQAIDSNTKMLSQAQGQLQFTANEQNIAVKPLQFKLDNSSLTGALAVNTQQSKITTNLNIDRINLNDYISSETSAKTSNQTHITKQNSATSANSSSLPKIQAQVNIGSLTVNQFNLNNLAATINTQKNMISIAPIKTGFYQGTAQANIAINLAGNNPQFSVNGTLNKIQAGELYKALTSNDQFSGIADINVDLKAQGTTSESIRQTLAGSVRLSLQNGVYKGANILKLIQNGLAILKPDVIPQASTSDQTLFSKLSASFQISKGIAYNNDLLLVSPYLQVHGQGAINLAQEQLGLQLRGTRVDKNNNATPPMIPIMVTGSWDNPHFNIDAKTLVADQLKQRAQKLVSDFTNKQGSNAAAPLGKLLKQQLDGLLN